MKIFITFTLLFIVSCASWVEGNRKRESAFYVGCSKEKVVIFDATMTTWMAKCQGSKKTYRCRTSGTPGENERIECIKN